MGFTILTFSRLIDYLLEYHHEPTQFFFIGLIIGVLPFIIRQAEVKKHFTGKHIGVVVLVAIMMASLGFLKPNEAIVISDVTLLSALGLFFSGWLASMAMLLPGISGSFILLLLGVYSTVISALSNLNLPIIIIVGAGAAVGFIVSSKAISFLLRVYPHMTFAVIMGLIIGSIFVISPGFPTGSGTILLCCITFGAGILVTKIFTKHSNQIDKKK
jgi:putative membrane protein